MNLVDSFKSAFIRCFDYETRSSRSEFWWFNLFVLALEFVGNIWDASLGDSSGWGTMYVLILLGTTIPALAVGARRLHDLNKSGWLQLLAITIIGLIPLIIWYATGGTKKNNPHGKPIKIKK